MSLESISDLTHAARRRGYALGYFESWNLESLQGVLDAAEETRSPIILGFNGNFLSGPGRKAHERLVLYAALGKAAAQSASVPCGLIFNECPRDEWVSEAITLGFNLVMPADPTAPFDEYARRVARITKQAHARGVAVEAEVGELPCGVQQFGAPRKRSGNLAHASAGKIPTKVGTPNNSVQAADLAMDHNGSLTDPSQAAAFVEATGVDLLAVSVGNVHMKVNGEQPLDLDRLTAIHKRVSVPLVLHGGTGIAAESLCKAVALGVAKVNYGTYLKQRYLAAVRSALARDIPNPHTLLGMGGPEDVMVAGRRAVREAVLERITTLGCCGKG